MWLRSMVRDSIIPALPNRRIVRRQVVAVLRAHAGSMCAHAGSIRAHARSVGQRLSRVLIVAVMAALAVAYHDVWCGPGTVPGQAAGCPLYFESPLTPGTIERMGADLRRGVVASGDIFVSRPEEVQHILEVIPEAVAVDMESGAIAQVCHLKNIPFVCMRVISDTPGATHDNIAQYENFWEDAPRHTFDVLHRLLEVL